MSNIQIICVPPNLFGRVWPYAGHWLLRGFEAARDVPVLATMDAIRFGEVNLWLIVDDGKLCGAFLTQIMAFADDGKWVSLFALAGTGARRWSRRVAQRMDAFAKSEGARGFRFCGRRGWARAVPGATILGERAPNVFAFQRAA